MPNTRIILSSFIARHGLSVVYYGDRRDDHEYIPSPSTKYVGSHTKEKLVALIHKNGKMMELIQQENLTVIRKDNKPYIIDYQTKDTLRQLCVDVGINTWREKTPTRSLVRISHGDMVALLHRYYMSNNMLYTEKENKEEEKPFKIKQTDEQRRRLAELTKLAKAQREWECELMTRTM